MPPKDYLLIGSHSLRLQAGARITLPSEWREELAGRKTLLVVKPTTRPFIVLIPADTLCKADDEAIRRLGLPVHKRCIDARGRIRLPRELIEAAGLKADLVAVGVLSGIELWDPKAFDYHIRFSNAWRGAAAEIGF